MRNITLKPAFDNSDHKSNYNVINQHIDDDYYVVDYYPEDVVLMGNATPPTTAATIIGLASGNEQLSVVNFTNGNIDEIKLNLRSRQYWEKGNVECTVYYSGSTGSTNNIMFGIRGFTSAIGASILPAATVSVDETTAGPSSANLLNKYTFTGYLPFSREMELVYYRLYRWSTNASDTYAGDVYVPMIRLRLIPANIQSGLQGTA